MKTILHWHLLVLLASFPFQKLAAQDTRVPVTSLATVVVLATNSPETEAQSLPEALSSIPASQLTAADVDSVRALPRLVPNLTQSHAGVQSFSDIYGLRGIANTEFFSDPAVISYVDDVPSIGGPGYPTDLLAVDHVNVYYGPQGTRFGMNSEAGVIDITTREPGNEFGADGNVSASTFNTWRVQAMTSGPLMTNRLFFSLAGEYVTSDGYIRNTYLGIHADQQENLYGRATVRWDLSETWSMDFAATGTRFDDGVGVTSLSSNPRVTRSEFENQYRQSLDSESFRVRGQAGGLALTSITARGKSDVNPFLLDPDFSPLTGNTGVTVWVQTQWSEELRVRPVSPPDSWDWHAGFFFSTADTELNRTANFVFPPAGSSERDVVLQQEHFDSYALFGEITRIVHDCFDVTLGLRLEYDPREWRGTRATTVGPLATPLNEDKDYFNAAPKLTLAYHLTDDVLVYGSTGLGFKPGGFTVFVNDPALREYKTEHLWANELGLKSTWLAGTLTANADVFYYDVKDYQVEQFDGLSVTVANAPRARALGAELEVSEQPKTGLELTGFFGYTDVRLEHFTDPFTGVTVNDTRPPGVAEFNGGLALQYHHRFGWFGRIDYTAVGDTFYDAANTSAFEQGAYGLLHARVGFEREHFGLFLFGENLTNESYYTKKIPSINAGAPGPPQTFGIMLTARY